MGRHVIIASVALSILGISAVAHAATPPAFIRGPISIQSYDGKSDDLLTGGLGKTGIAGPVPTYADPAKPTKPELRRNTLYNNYRALYDMAPGGGYGVLYGPNIDANGNDTLGEGKIAGTEYLAYEDGGVGKQNVTIMVQVPKSFSPKNPCIVAGPSSGSRGVYGALASAGDWGLKKGCAVAYTDKGTGFGLHDLQNNTVNLVDGMRANARTAGMASNFTADLNDEELAAYNILYPNRVSVKHAHSRQNPEKDWGKNTLRSVEFAFWILNQYHKQGGGGYTPANTIVIAASISNGGWAVLKAGEEDTKGLIDGVVASEPNINIPTTVDFNIVQGSQSPFRSVGKSLLDYMTYQNIYQPCASLAASNAGAPSGVPANLAANRCLSLKEKGLLSASDQAGQAEEAQRKINEYGLLKEQNFLAPMHYTFFVHPAVAMNYANTFGRFSVKDNLCGYSYAAADPKTGNIIPAPANNVASIFSMGNAVPPVAGISLINNLSVGGPREERQSVSQSTGRQDMNLDGALCIRAVVTGKDPVTGEALSGTMHQNHLRIAAGIAQLTASGKVTKPTIMVAGRSDAVVALNFAARAYYGFNQLVQGSASNLHYYEVVNAHHLDAINSMAAYSTRLVPLYVYFRQGANMIYDHLKTGKPLPPSQVVRTTTRKIVEGKPEQMGMAHVPPVSMNPAKDDLIRFEKKSVMIPD